MLFLSGFELYSRWVPLKKAYRTREMAWIDFKKAFDMVPDSWLIIKMLRSLWGWEIELAA